MAENNIIELRNKLKQITDNKEEFIKTCLRIEEINEILGNYMCEEMPLSENDYMNETKLLQELEELKDKFGYNLLFRYF